MTKLILPLLSLAVIAAAAPALGAADCCDSDPTYIVTRTWVEGHWERNGCHEEWVSGHWVETYREEPRERVIVVHEHDHGHRDWRDDRREDRHDGWRERDEHEHHSTAVIAPVPVPLPIPVFFPFFHHR